MVMSSQVSDFASPPAGESPSLVFSHPVFSRGVFIGLLAVEVASDTVYSILDNYTGLDETGETVISQVKEERILLLNPTRNAPYLRFKEDTFAKQPESAMYKALRGERGFGPAIDYRGQVVLAAWEYLPRLRWGLVVKKDLSEVLNPSARLKNIAFSIILPAIGVVALIAFFLAQRLSQPLSIIAENAKKIAEGNLRSYYGFPMPNNELKTLAYALCALHDHLKSFVHTTQTTEKLVANLQDKALYSHKTVLQRIMRFSRHMQGLNRSVLERLRALAQLSQKSILEGDASQHKIKTLLSLIQAIEGVKHTLEEQLLTLQAQTKAVQSIFMQALKMADRSNILALNTTLEMHQMASSTLGFRVVAQEIQKLSEDMDAACLNIDNHAQALDQTLIRASGYLKQFSKIVEEESQAVYGMQDSLGQIMEHLTQMPKSLKETLNAVEEQTASIQRVEASMQAFQDTLFQNAHTLDRTKQSLQHLRHPSLAPEKELAEFKI
jgi:methyl-accepting chemotaxis protein WspA